MRFRLASEPPLLPFKAWYDVAEDSSISSIHGLKHDICERLSLSLSIPQPDLLRLHIEGFELLNDSRISVIREHDLVCLSMDVTSGEMTNKRKAESAREPSRKRARISASSERRQSARTKAGLVAGSVDSSSSVSDSSTDSETDSTSESGSSDSESDSSDSDSSLTSSSELVEVRPSKPSAQLLPTAKKQAVVTVPPGQGKSSTRSRNARRRAKRAIEREQATQVLLAANVPGEDSSNAIPLGDRGAIQPVPPTASTLAETQSAANVFDSLSTTLRNKNKKKGFKHAMVGVTPQRLVFANGEETSTAAVASEASTRPTTPYQRLVKPSEKQAQGLLPSNLFVTSVEVESLGWDRKKKKKSRNDYYQDLEGDRDGGEVPDDVKLEYGGEEPPTNVIDFESLEGQWDGLAEVSDLAQLEKGALVCWKELAIDPIKMEPGILLHAALVDVVDSELKTVSVTLQRRPGQVEGEDVEAGDDMVTMSFCDVLNSAWKIARAQH